MQIPPDRTLPYAPKPPPSPYKRWLIAGGLSLICGFVWLYPSGLIAEFLTHRIDPTETDPDMIAYHSMFMAFPLWMIGGLTFTAIFATRAHRANRRHQK